MTIQRQFLFWTAGIIVFALVVYMLSEILLPFVAGLAIAYFLDPVADRLEKLGLGRLASVSIIVGIFAMLLLLFMLLLAPVLTRQVSNFASNLPGYIEQFLGFIDLNGPGWLKDLMTHAAQGRDPAVSDLAGKGAEWIASLLTSLWSGGMAVVSLFSLLIVTPVVAFYMLYDWDRMVAVVDGYLPRDNAETLRELAREIDAVMAGFVRGQGTVCLLLGLFYAIGLTLAGLNFGLMIGMLSGLLSFIPFVGTIVGLVLSMGVALVQFWPDWVSIVIVLGIFVAGQMIEGNFLSPKLVGGKIGLHPVWLIFALFAFGYMFGFVGMLLAVPVAAAIGVLARFGLRKYTASPLYLGHDGEVGGEAGPPPAPRQLKARRRKPPAPKP